MSGAHPCVLIVDGERLIRWSMAQALGGLGYGVVEARDGRDALEKAGLADVAIIDRDLPDGDGARLAATLKHRGRLRAVILTTTHCTDELERCAAHDGLAAVVEKPFELYEMLALVRRGLDRS